MSENSSDQKTKKPPRVLMTQGLDMYKVWFAHLNSSSKIVILNQEKTKILFTCNEKRGVFLVMKMVMNQALGSKGALELLKQKSIQVTEDFHPDEPLLFGDVKDLRLNLYKLPSYRKPEVTPYPDISDFHGFMKKFIPCEVSRRATLKWAWQSNQRKAATHLLLVGAKGSGKTFFSSTFLAAYHGPSNHFVESIRQSRSGFDSCDYCKTAIFVDECSFPTEERKSNVKFRLNQWASFNVKYQSMSGSKRAFASIVYACNNPESIMVEVDDRCFTIPDITDKPATFDEEFRGYIQRLSKTLELDSKTRDPYLKAIYNYLEDEFKDENVDDEILIYSNNFKKLVKYSDSEYRRAIYATAHSNKTFIADDVNELIRRRRISTSVTVTPEILIHINDLYKERFGESLYRYDDEKKHFISYSHEVTL